MAQTFLTATAAVDLSGGSVPPSDQPSAEGDATLFAQQDSSLVRLDSMRADARFNWLDGNGVSVVVIDTGIDLNHPFFGGDANGNGISDRIVYSYDFSGFDDSNASDFDGHGSNVASIIGSSNGTYTGMAPGVNIIALKVFPDGGGGASTTDIGQALSWVVANRAAYKIAAVNMSLGVSNTFFNSPASTSYSSQMANLASNGTAVVVASGNSYTGSQGVSTPSCDPNAWSVGAVWDRNAGSFSWGTGVRDITTGPDRIISFSQRSTTMTTIFAPGGAITGANATGGTISQSGTSQASPHVAGLTALMQQLAMGVAGRFLSVADLKTTMLAGAATIFDGDDENDNVANTFAFYKRVDAYGWANQVLGLLFGGTTGADTLSGTVIGDTIHGNAGNDSINGQGGDDTLFGDAGSDFLKGGTGNDSLFGGANNDTFFMDGLGWDSVYDFSGTEVDKIDLTSFVTMHNIAQVFDRSQQFNNDTIIDFGGGAGVTIKNFIRNNLAASHFNFQAVTIVEQTGVTAIAQVANTYFMDYTGGSLGPQIKFGGGAISPTSFGSWRPIGAEQIGGNFQIVFRNGAADQYTIWFTDNGGNVQATTNLVSGGSWFVQGLETRFGQDLNSDGQVGAVTTGIESVGVTRLSRVADSYFLYNGVTTNGPQLRFGGGYVQVGQFSSWAPIGAEQVSGNYQVVFKNGSADQYVVWFTDSSGNFQASTNQVSGSSWLIQGLETAFGQNLNGDGTTGPTTTNIESVSVTRLARVADSYFLYNGATTNGPQIRINGSYFMVGQSGNWAPIGAEQIGGNYQIVFKNGAADQYVVWFTDSLGNYQASTSVVAGGSYYIQGLEARFGQDLNGDGTTGAVTTVIETAGVTRLARVADSWFMYQGATPTSGVQIRFGGAYAAVGQFGNWTPLGAEQIGGNYQIVFKNGAADQYVTWFADSNGNFQTAGGLMSGGSSALRALEVRFGQDFNSNGTVGTSEPETSGEGDDADTFGANGQLVSGGDAGASLGRETLVGHTPTEDMALLTSYMASSFASPAGEGAGVVPAAPSSDQDYLTRPAT